MCSNSARSNNNLSKIPLAVSQIDSQASTWQYPSHDTVREPQI